EILCCFRCCLPQVISSLDVELRHKPFKTTALLAMLENCGFTQKGGPAHLGSRIARPNCSCQTDAFSTTVPVHTILVNQLSCGIEMIYRSPPMMWQRSTNMPRQIHLFHPRHILPSMVWCHRKRNEAWKQTEAAEAI